MKNILLSTISKYITPGFLIIGVIIGFFVEQNSIKTTIAQNTQKIASISKNVAELKVSFNHETDSFRNSLSTESTKIDNLVKLNDKTSNSIGHFVDRVDADNRLLLQIRDADNRFFEQLFIILSMGFGLSLGAIVIISRK